MKSFKSIHSDCGTDTLSFMVFINHLILYAYIEGFILDLQNTLMKIPNSYNVKYLREGRLCLESMYPATFDHLFTIEYKMVVIEHFVSDNGRTRK